MRSGEALSEVKESYFQIFFIIFFNAMESLLLTGTIDSLDTERFNEKNCKVNDDFLHGKVRNIIIQIISHEGAEDESTEEIHITSKTLCNRHLIEEKSGVRRYTLTSN